MLWSSFPSCYLHAQLLHFPKSRMTWPACKVHGLSLSSDVSFFADTIIIHPCVQTSKQFPNYTCTLPQPGKITLTTLDTQNRYCQNKIFGNCMKEKYIWEYIEYIERSGTETMIFRDNWFNTVSADTLAQGSNGHQVNIWLWFYISVYSKHIGYLDHVNMMVKRIYKAANFSTCSFFSHLLH